MLLIVLFLLGVAYVVWFTDLFKKEGIQIITQMRPMRSTRPQRNTGAEPVYPVSFTFNGKYLFTSVKVVGADDLATNKYPVALLHYISDSNSVPTKFWLYGHEIKGMRPAIARAKPEQLQPDVKYVLLLETDRLKARTNFHTSSPPAP